MAHASFQLRMGHTLLGFFLLSLFLYLHLDFKAKMYRVTGYTVKLCWSDKPFLFERGELKTTNRYICGSHGPNAEATPQAPDRHQISPGWAASKGFRRHSNTKLKITFFIDLFIYSLLFAAFKNVRKTNKGWKNHSHKHKHISYRPNIWYRLWI